MFSYLYHCYLRPLVETFRAPDKATLICREIAEAERRLLVAQTGLDFAKAMVTYEASRVARLSQALVPKQSAKAVAYDLPKARPAVQRVR